MKKQLNISWDGIQDATGYLFSFAKSLACAVKNSPWSEYAEDIVATSGFAFRMWVNKDLCPSATSIWGFDCQKPWVESGGLICEYVGRYWGQEHIEKEKQLEAIKIIKASITQVFRNGVLSQAMTTLRRCFTHWQSTLRKRTRQVLLIILRKCPMMLWVNVKFPSFRF